MQSLRRFLPRCQAPLEAGCFCWNLVCCQAALGAECSGRRSSTLGSWPQKDERDCGLKSLLLQCWLCNLFCQAPFNDEECCFLISLGVLVISQSGGPLSGVLFGPGLIRIGPSAVNLIRIGPDSDEQ
jgi:hypothetical protein